MNGNALERAVCFQAPTSLLLQHLTTMKKNCRTSPTEVVMKGFGLVCSLRVEVTCFTSLSSNGRFIVAKVL